MDGLYAPQSPDLSSFFTSPSKTQQSYHPPLHSTANSTASYTPQSPTIPSFNNPAIAPTSTYNHHAESAPDSLYSQPPQTFAHSFGGSSRTHNSIGDGSTITSGYDQFDASNTQYQIPDLPPQHTFPRPHEQPPQNYYAPLQSYPSDLSTPAYLRSEDSAYSNASTNEAYITSPISHTNQSSSIMSRRAGKQNDLSQSTFQSDYQHQSLQAQQPQHLRDPNPTNIQISTKFPTARIKRIMQADEEVGKVAQVTPPAVNKALELFMIALVTGAADKAKEKGGKRITAQHLKQVVLGDEQFDFLAEIVGRVEEGKDDGSGPGRKRKTKKEESDSSDEAAEAKKKKGKGGRKKKNPDE